MTTFDGDAIAYEITALKQDLERWTLEEIKKKPDQFYNEIEVDCIGLGKAINRYKENGGGGK